MGKSHNLLSINALKVQGVDFEYINSANCGGADLSWSNLKKLVQSPLDKEAYEYLEKIFTDALGDTSARSHTVLTANLKKLQDAVERPTNLTDFSDT